MARTPSLGPFLRELLTEAGAVLTHHFGSSLSVEYKADQSIVTNADLASEAVVLKAIREQFPDDLIFSEESGVSDQDRRAGRQVWIVDPLDGTTNFANGYPYFCISVGCGTIVESGRIAMRAGGIFDPLGERMFIAEKGRGASLNGDPIYVSAAKPLQQAFLCTGIYYNRESELSNDLDRFVRVATECQALRRDGAAALDLANVAAGVFDGFWQFGLQPWDVAAGSLLVAEAGGRACNVGSQHPFDCEQRSIVAGSAEIVDSLASFL